SAFSICSPATCINGYRSFSAARPRSSASSSITTSTIRAWIASTVRPCSKNARCSFNPNQTSREALMSAKHPVIAVTGSSGAGTTSVTRTFNWIFRRENINAVLVEGDSFHRYDREEMKKMMAEAAAKGDNHFSHFGPQTNLFKELEELFSHYGETGRGKIRRYLHNEKEAEPFKQEPGTFTEWQEIPKDTDLMFYEGLHGAVVTPEVNVARHADLTIGVVPIINLEWIQKLHRDRETRGYSTEAVV